MQGAIKAIVLVLFGFVILAPFASTYPDGLEKVAETMGIEEPEPIWEGLMPDYTMPMVEYPYASTVLAGFFGTLMVLGASLALGKILSTKSRRQL